MDAKKEKVINVKHFIFVERFIPMMLKGRHNEVFSLTAPHRFPIYQQIHGNNAQIVKNPCKSAAARIKNRKPFLINALAAYDDVCQRFLEYKGAVARQFKDPIDMMEWLIKQAKYGSGGIITMLDAQPSFAVANKKYKILHHGGGSAEQVYEESLDADNSEFTSLAVESVETLGGKTPPDSRPADSPAP